MKIGRKKLLKLLIANSLITATVFMYYGQGIIDLWRGQPWAALVMACYATANIGIIAMKESL